MAVDLGLGESGRILACCRDRGLTRAQTAYVLATAFWETNRTMQPVEEAYWLSDAWRKKNLRYYPWHGRGFVQLTWEANYRKAAAHLNTDLTTDPARVMEPDVATQILVQGMCEGWFTGARLDSFVGGLRQDFLGARRVVNASDRAAEIAALAEDYLAALQELPKPWFWRIFNVFSKGKAA